MLPSPAFPHPVPVSRRPSWINAFDDDDLPSSSSSHHRPDDFIYHPFQAPTTYYDPASYTHTPTLEPEFDCVGPLPTIGVTNNVWQYDEYPSRPDYFNTGSFHYQYDASVYQKPSNLPSEYHYPSDQLHATSHPSIPNYYTHCDTAFVPSAPAYHNNRVAHPSLSVTTAGLVAPVSETHQQYHWAKQTGSEHDLAALAGQCHAQYTEGHVQTPAQSLSPSTPSSHPCSDSYAAAVPHPTQEEPPMAVPSQQQSFMNMAAYQNHHTRSTVHTEIPYYHLPDHSQIAYPQHEYPQPRFQEPDGPYMDHIPFPEADDTPQASQTQVAAPPSPPAFPSNPYPSDGRASQTLNVHIPIDEPVWSQGATALPSPTVAVPPPSTTESSPTSPVQSDNRERQLRSRLPQSPRTLPRTHNLRVLARSLRSPSPRTIERSTGGAAARVAPLPSKRLLEKKPPLACLFCRARKIACGPPPPGSKDKTCNQCARRSLKCEYPLESRRGMRKKRTTIVNTNIPAEDSSSAAPQSPHKE